MSTLFAPGAIAKEFLPQEFRITVWSRLKPYYNELLRRHINQVAAFNRWWADFRELKSVVKEEFHLRFFRLHQSSNDKKALEAFNYFSLEIFPRALQFEQQILKRLLSLVDRIQVPHFSIPFLQQELNSYNEQGVQLQQEIIVKAFNRPSLTSRREIPFCPSDNHFSYFDELLQLRQQLAKNGNHPNYTSYYFSRQDQQLHDKAAELRDWAKLLLRAAQPEHSLSAPKLLAPNFLKTNGASDLLSKAQSCLSAIHPILGQSLQLLAQHQCFDVKKRAGQSNTTRVVPMPFSKIPLMLMHVNRDSMNLSQFIYLSGLAHYYSSNPLQSFIEGPSTAAEFAAQSMVLMSTAHWGLFFAEQRELEQVRAEHLKQLLCRLRIALAIDSFEQTLYDPIKEETLRQEDWLALLSDAGLTVEDQIAGKQLFVQLCERPFFGLRSLYASLAALTLWWQYSKEPQAVVAQFMEAIQPSQAPTFSEKEEDIYSKWAPTADTIKKVATFVTDKIKHPLSY